MKKTFLLSIVMLFAVSATFVSCSSNDDPIFVKDGTLTLEMPINVTDVVLNSFEGTITNVQSGAVVALANPVKSGENYLVAIPELVAGNYNIAVKGNISFVKDGIDGTTSFEANSDGVVLSETVHELKMAINSFKAEGGFVISEIFFTGTTTPEDKQYSGGDAYIIITNNSDVTLFADSIAVLESQFMTIDKQDYTPNVMNEAFSVEAVYMIPGNGRSVAVEPGKSLTLAINAIDHREANPNSFDLSGADFEFYDESSNPKFTDPDGPATNLDKWYCYTLSFFLLHNRGFRAWALARIPIDKEQYLSQYLYRYNYEIVVEAGTYPMSQQAYKIPNEWIVDAVNCSVAAEYAWNVTHSSLDRGYAYCGTMDHDKTRYFHSVRRKMLYLKDGKPVLKDTNNSSDDFNSYVIASEIERQGTAIDYQGSACTQRTWDGVTPID